MTLHTEIDNKIIDSKTILNNIHVIFKSNQLNIITGKSGSGKTSLLNILSGLDFDYVGKTYLNDLPIHDFKQEEIFSQIYYLPINSFNLNDMTLKDNLSILSSDGHKINLLLEELSISHLVDKVMHTLSKGEQQRVALARAFLSSNPLLLIDEPTSNLDGFNAEKIFKLLKSESKFRTIIIATHDTAFAHKYADYVLNLDEGSIVSDVILSEKTKLEESNLNKTIWYSKKIVSKAIFKKVYANKSLLIISLLLMVLSLSTIFLSSTFANFDEHKTVENLIENIDYDFVKIIDLNYVNGIHPYFSLSENQNFRVLQLTNLQGYDVDTTFGSPVLNSMIGKNIDDYDITLFGYHNDEHNEYFPVILNESTMTYISHSFGIEYSIGDILPATFASNNLAFNIWFVIVDTFSSNHLYKEAEDDYFPSIIPFESYQRLVIKTGYYMDDLGDTFIEVVDLYNSFIDSNNLNQNYKYHGLWTVGTNIFVTKSNMITDTFYTYNEVPAEGGYYLYGRLPQSDDEIVINDISLFEKIGYDVDHPETLDAFFTTIMDGINTEFSSLLPHLTFPKKLKIVGAYGYKQGDTFKLVNNSSFIINTSLFDNIDHKVMNEDFILDHQFNIFYISPLLLTGVKENIINRSIQVLNSDFTNLHLIINNTKQMSEFLSVINIILSTICGLFLILLTLNNRQELLKTVSILLRIGVSKKIILKDILFHYLTISVLCTVVFLIIFNPLQNSITEVISSSIGFQGNLVFNNGYAFLITSAYIVLFSMISTLPNVMIKNETIITYIKQG